MQPVVHIPLPLQIVIDDVGWRCGIDGHERNEPYRTGAGRDHVPADYAAIASLGRHLNMRPLAAMVLCDWDKHNILRSVPSATWMGAKWDASPYAGSWREEAADILNRDRDFVELALHGAGHEYWDESGIIQRAEFADLDGQWRPRAEQEKHLDACAAILEANGLGAFPGSFVPPAFCFRFGDGEAGLVGLLKERGTKYISTSWINEPHGKGRSRELETVDFGVDAGLMVVRRSDNSAPWFGFNTCDGNLPGGPIMGLHWPNLLMHDPADNESAVLGWVDLLRSFDKSPDRMLARDTAACWNQLAYRYGSQIQPSDYGARLVFTRLDKWNIETLTRSFALRVETDEELYVESPDATITESVFRPKDGFQVVTLCRAAGQSSAVLRWRYR